MNAAEMDALAKALVTPQRLPNPALVGKPADYIAKQVGMTIPSGTRALIAPLNGVGRDYPLSIEKLCPVLSFYVVQDWREGCERCIQILRYGGMGHTMSIHSKNEDVILQFGSEKASFSDLRKYADDTRINWPDDGSGSRDDARLRRMGRQHYIRQHFSASLAEHQAPRVRSPSRSEGSDFTGSATLSQGRFGQQWRRPARRAPAEAANASEIGGISPKPSVALDSVLE